MKTKSFKIKTILSVLTILLFLVSCKKDDLSQKENEQTDNVSVQIYKLPAPLKSELVFENDLIIFQSQKQFDDITNLLTVETENYIDEFFKQFDNDATQELVNNTIEEVGFNANAVYEAFENFHNFNSLRKKLVKAENEWLDNEVLTENNPSIHPLSERCLPVTNENGEYQIGSTIYRVEKSGLVYEIKNQDYEALQQIRIGINKDYKANNPNVLIHRIDAGDNLKSTNGSCVAYKRVTQNVYSGDYRMDMILDLDWDGYGSAAKAKTQAYKKKKKLFGGYTWKREWTSMTAQVHLNDYDSDCNYQGEHNSGIKSRSWAYYVSVHLYSAGAGYRVKQNGTFWGRYSTSRFGARYLSWQ